MEDRTVCCDPRLIVWTAFAYNFVDLDLAFMLYYTGCIQVINSLRTTELSEVSDFPSIVEAPR